MNVGQSLDRGHSMDLCLAPREVQKLVVTILVSLVRSQGEDQGMQSTQDTTCIFSFA